MSEIIVRTASSYPIYFRSSYDDLDMAFWNNGYEATKRCIVTDSNVAPLYLDKVQNIIRGVEPFIFEAGEARKHMGTLADMYSHFLANKLDRRKSVIVALGGGVTGDLAGFAAATYMRGIPYVQLPTSLLAQVDSSVGGKTAVDFEGVKNLVGAFYQPKFVYINTDTLHTLPQQEFISGLGEVVKHGLISSTEYYRYISENRDAILALENSALMEVVAGSCRIKANVVEGDERESGPREVLNFGHCVGHAIESLSGYSLPHGHCVSIGMCAALYWSQKMGHITEAERAEACDLLRALGLPTTVTGTEYTLEAILSFMHKDKKNLSDSLRLVRLKGIGQAYTDNTIPKEVVLEAVASVIEGDTLSVQSYESSMKEAGQDKSFLSRTISCAEDFEIVDSEVSEER